jgi:hypothetical protein
MKHELYDGDIELIFDERKHVYRVNDIIVPSVTGITKVIDKSGPLMWWGIGCALDYVEENMGPAFYENVWDDEVARKQFLHDAHRAHFRASKKAMDIGTMAHEWIEKFLEGDEQPMPKNKQLRSTITSWLRWADDNRLTAYETEFKCYSREYGYAGTCDYDGMVGSERCIVDWKTGKAVYPEHRFQTVAYLDAREEELGEPDYDARWVVVLPKDGGEIIAQRFGQECNETDRAGFLGALSLHRSLQEIKDAKKRK